MNDSFATTGLRKLTIGSLVPFEVSPFYAELPWKLAGGTVTLRLTDPNGNNYALPATIDSTGYSALVNWTVIAPAGTWVRAWDMTDAVGVRQVMLPRAFNVVSSPS